MLSKYKEVSLLKMRRLEKFGVYCFGFGLVWAVLSMPFHIDTPVFAESWAMDTLVRVASLLVIATVSIVLHEALHGLFFWTYTGKVKFGFKLWSKIGMMAYATSPNSILSRGRMIMITIAPQILSVVVLLAIGFMGLPNLARHGLLNMVAINLGGGCFDLYFVFLLLKEKGKVLVEDTMTGAILYRGDGA